MLYVIYTLHLKNQVCRIFYHNIMDYVLRCTLGVVSLLKMVVQLLTLLYVPLFVLLFALFIALFSTSLYRVKSDATFCATNSATYQKKLFKIIYFEILYFDMWNHFQ